MGELVGNPKAIQESLDALNSKITSISNADVQNCAGEAAVKTYLESVLNTMVSGESRLLRINNTDASYALMQVNVYYEGYAFCTFTNDSSNKNIVWIGYNANGKDVVFSCSVNVWQTPYSLNSKITPIVFSMDKTFNQNETQTITFPEKGVYLVTYTGNWANADCGAWIVFISTYDNVVTELKKNGCTFAITNNASMIGTFTYTHTSADSGTLKAIKM